MKSYIYFLNLLIEVPLHEMDIVDILDKDFEEREIQETLYKEDILEVLYDFEDKDYWIHDSKGNLLLSEEEWLEELNKKYHY